MKPALAIALDVQDAQAALSLAAQFGGLPVWMKIGLELFTAGGPDVVCKIRALGFPVFLDLKFHDIPNTVKGAVRSAVGLGADLLTVHISGGEAMLAAAVEGKGLGLADKGAKPGALDGPKILGITMLTSSGAGQSREEIEKSVVAAALCARQCGLDGVVCSGLEVAAVKQRCGASFLGLCPGIRFAGEGSGDDQARVVTPSEAVGNGADYLVMGRPVTRSADPRRAALRALAQMGIQGYE